jgi:hypothetical protein
MGHQALRGGPPLIIKIDGSSGFARKPRPYFDSEGFIEFTYRKILCDFINKYLWDTTLGSPFKKGDRGIYSVTAPPANLEIIVPG